MQEKNYLSFISLFSAQSLLGAQRAVHHGVCWAWSPLHQHPWTLLPWQVTGNTETALYNRRRRTFSTLTVSLGVPSQLLLRPVPLPDAVGLSGPEGGPELLYSGGARPGVPCCGSSPLPRPQRRAGLDGRGPTSVRSGHQPPHASGLAAGMTVADDDEEEKQQWSFPVFPPLPRMQRCTLVVSSLPAVTSSSSIITSLFIPVIQSRST